MREGGDIGVLRLKVEQVRLVWAGRTITDRFPDDDRYETVLTAIHGARPHAAAGRDPRDQHGVHAERCQRRGERGTEEGAGVLLDDVGLARERFKPARKLR